MRERVVLLPARSFREGAVPLVGAERADGGAGEVGEREGVGEEGGDVVGVQGGEGDAWGGGAEDVCAECGAPAEYYLAISDLALSACLRNEEKAYRARSGEQSHHAPRIG